MLRPLKTALWALFLFATPSLFAAEGGVSPRAYVLTEVFGLPITNSMVTTLVLSVLIVIVVRLMVGRISMVPTVGQSIIENMVEWIEGMIEPIVGKRMVRPTFPLLIGLFVFILINNWSGLLPGVGTFGHYELGHELTAQEAAEYREEGKTVVEHDGAPYSAQLKYYFRPANSDLNTTLALALVSMAFWLYYVLRYAGVKVFLFDLFGNKAEKSEIPGAIYYMLFMIFFLVGIIEVISIFFRPISLSIRLYGNIFGGESLLASMHGIVMWLLPIPFYFLELLIGFVQALVFTLLVAVYIGLICNHESEEHGHGGAPALES